MECFALWHRTAPVPHDEDADAGADVSWLRHVRREGERRGATVLGPLGGALVLLFDALDLDSGVELALSLLHDAEKSPEVTAAPRIAFGGALGEIDFTPSEDGTVTYHGSAIDRAQTLANRARSGEVVLDARSREAAQATFLFHRTVGTGEASVRGHAIDREEPRVSACRRHFVHLVRPPTPPSIADAFSPVREDAGLYGCSTVFVRGDVGSGARRVLGELEFTLRPALVLRCLGVPAGIEPLGSLRAALVRTFGPGGARLARLGSLALDAADHLGRIARGEPVAFDSALAATAALLKASHEPDANKPWLIVDADDVDESTLELVGRIAREPRCDVLIVVHVAPDMAVPQPLDHAHRSREIRVPELRFDEVRALAEKMLREPTGGDVARRVAMTSASSPLAVVECVRAWIASGDVVRRGRSFVFRVGPRPTSERGSYADWAAERIALLDDDSLRLLEVLAMAPPTMSAADLEAVTSVSGTSPGSYERALVRLTEDRFVTSQPWLEIDNAILRAVVLTRMPTARRADIAGQIASRLASRTLFARAGDAHFLAEADRSDEAASAFLDAAEQAVGLGHPRACIRLASAAVQASPNAEVRVRAAALLRGATLRVVSGGASTSTGRASVEVPAEAIESPATVVGEALRVRDFDRVERYVDLAIAEGASLSAADRLRAIVAFMRGETSAAMIAAHRSRDRAATVASRARSDLLVAMLEIHEGRLRPALRRLVATLALVRESGDAPGEVAVLRALSLCFHALSRPEDAARFLDLATRRAA